jgi:integrase
MVRDRGECPVQRWYVLSFAMTNVHCLLAAFPSILQAAEDERLIVANPVRNVPAPKQDVDPDELLGQGKRRALTPEEAGQLLACFPPVWWDHVVTLLGTGVRFGELGGLRRHRVLLDRHPQYSRSSPPATRQGGSAAASRANQEPGRHP